MVGICVDNLCSECTIQIEMVFDWPDLPGMGVKRKLCCVVINTALSNMLPLLNFFASSLPVICSGIRCLPKPPEEYLPCEAFAPGPCGKEFCPARRPNPHRRDCGQVRQDGQQARCWSRTQEVSRNVARYTDPWGCAPVELFSLVNLF